MVIHLLALKCGPSLDKESSREEIKLAERMANILKDFEARRLEVDEDEQAEVVEEEEEDWDPQVELMDVERQANSEHVITRDVRSFCLRVPNSGFRPFWALPFRYVFRLFLHRKAETVMNTVTY
ncbi:unnamed protein product [Heligmosomoides polygyrus]|uniref:Uncharacterized protein n=1 Tax=Heligmosomoides polygyrus TaxID=6339 RepID=A0A183FS74_HELPZ|nr:unnamed protein product [Heligmosomoides polygyrus]